MNPIDRRRFLAGGLRASAAAGLGTALATITDQPEGDTASAAPRRAEAAATAADRTEDPTPDRLIPGHLSVNGLINPVGVDPVENRRSAINMMLGLPNMLVISVGQAII